MAVSKVLFLAFGMLCLTVGSLAKENATEATEYDEDSLLALGFVGNSTDAPSPSSPLPDGMASIFNSTVSVIGDAIDNATDAVGDAWNNITNALDPNPPSNSASAASSFVATVATVGAFAVSLFAF